MITLLQITAGISGILERIIEFIRSLIPRIAQALRGLFGAGSGSGSFDINALFGSQGQGSDVITAGNTTTESAPAAAPPAAAINWFNLALAIIIFAAVVFAIIYVWQRHTDRQTKKEVLGSLKPKNKEEKGPEKEEIAQITAEAVVNALLQAGFLHVTPTLNVEKMPKNESDFIDLTEQQEEEG